MAVADRRPPGRLGCGDDGDGLVDFGSARRKGLDDGADLVGVDAPHAGVAQQRAGALGRAFQRTGVLELGHHAVRRCLGVRVARRGDFQLGADHQRVVELPLGRHRPVPDGAAVRRHKVHQPERQRLDARVRGDGKHVAQGAVGFDQRVQRHRSATGRCHGLRCACHIGQAIRLGQHQVGGRHGGGQQHGQHIGKLRVVHRQQAHAHTAMLVVGAGQQCRDQQRMLDLATHGRAVFVVQRHVEHRAHLRLQAQALAHQRLGAGVVVAHRQRRAGVVAVKQRLSRMQRRFRHSKCFTPSCSPVSSARVLSMQA